MSGWLGSNWLRVAMYAVAAAAAVLAARRERRRARVEVGLWPTFWLITAGLFLMMVVGRAANLGGLATELGRSEALSHGWYNNRRKVQAVVVGSIGATWFVTVVVALSRVPARRRRYLPAAVIVFTLMCFAGIRLVSLHQVDGLLERRNLAGVKVGAVLELVGVSIATAVTFWQPRSAAAHDPAAPSSTVETESAPGPA